MKVFGLVILMLILSQEAPAAHGDQSDPCSIFSGSLQDIGFIAWKKWIANDVQSPATFQYAQNTFDAVKTVFDPWVRGQRPDQAYLEMLKEMHKVIVAGLDGQSFFENEGRQGEISVDRYKSNIAFPGQPRNELKLQSVTAALASIEGAEASDREFVQQVYEEGFITFPMDHMKTLRPIIQNDLLHRSLQWLRTARVLKDVIISEDRNSATATMLLKVFGVEVAVPMNLRIEDGGPLTGPIVRRVSWKTGLVDDTLVVEKPGLWNDSRSHYFPAAEATPLFVTLSERLLRNILEFSTPTNLTETNNLVRAIAVYHHSLINAHMFFRVNQSLLMLQANYLLFRYGLSPIYHQDLDMWAYVLPAEEYAKVFLHKVLEHADD